ncbi:MAG: protein kinase [Bacteroidota bacterium]
MPSIGQTVSHYRLLELLGTGGMGTVYKAEDLKLGRAVALKFLPSELTRDPDAKQRFVQEARTASLLQHKNICVVYDIDETEDGQIFISMECLEGETLRKKIDSGPLQPGESARIATQIALGLGGAHGAGIVHRDVKPANIIIAHDGTVKILDFGLAKTKGRGLLTKEGITLGTAAYMSPEQIRGDPIDHRTDIWSLGVVLYEMATGRRPFGGEYEQAAMYSIVHEKHRPASQARPGVPVSLERIINRCLEKHPADRYPDAAAVADELQGVDRRPTGRRAGVARSIAVLPFADISPGKDNQYISDGLTEEIIAKLSRLRNIRVLLRTAVMNYDRAGKSARQIASDLGVEYVLEGSVRKHGFDLRITMQLIDADQDAYLWAETYDGSMDDVFVMQEKVADRVVKALKVRVTPTEKRTLEHRGTEDPEAYQLYLRGRYFWNKRSGEGHRTAIRYFEEAIAKDPGYALAWAGVADSYNLITEFAPAARQEFDQRAYAAVRKALELDPRLAEAHASYGSLTMINEWDWKTSERELKLAIKLNPNYATAHHWYAEWAQCRGRTSEAIASITRAAELDPLSPAILKDHGMILYYSRDYDGAIIYAHKTLELDPHFSSAHRLLSLAYQGKGMIDEAITENRLWGELMGKGIEAALGLAQCYAAAGRQEEALRTMAAIDAAEYAVGNHYRGAAMTYAPLGMADQAFEALERAYELKAESLCNLKVDPKMDRLRPDPRFLTLLRRVGLEK